MEKQKKDCKKCEKIRALILNAGRSNIIMKSKIKEIMDEEEIDDEDDNEDNNEGREVMEEFR